jgi:hypothetical protein
MRTISRKTSKLTVGTAAVVLIGSGAAFAYWTTGGAGTGSATTGDTVSLTAVQTSTVTGMRPGDAAQALSGNFNNPNSGPTYVTSVTASISAVDKAAGVPGTCDATDYVLANATMSVNAQIPAGNAQGTWSGATIKFNNKTSVNQDACKGATVTLTYTIVCAGRRSLASSE